MEDQRFVLLQTLTLALAALRAIANFSIHFATAISVPYDSSQIE
ncbi:hypothetical protein SAMN05444920_105619 [Nonomuraea solani]|uniref:Uncharacterized protein n=1 Tax=Nonomuraea solani TaxID=1144553 RepID=A0A1H6DMC9_9ACTN|nr:hypothetical protein [Nonomuraea solani]SEG85973.1 hypothetical protein SAMN05444920_105619 [Nonomuraea solani]